MLPGEKKYPHIFSPVQVGKVWAKNKSTKDENDSILQIYQKKI